MDQDIFDQFIEQLRRYVRERLLPAEKGIIESDLIPDEILAELNASGRVGPERMLDFMLRGGPFGDGFGSEPEGTSLDDLLDLDSRSREQALQHIREVAA